MSTLSQKVSRIRSKNAGPFWITIDIFCGSIDVYKDVCMNLNNQKVADLLKVKGQDIKRFEIEKLKVIKFSIPRKIPQGHVLDRDMHGAQMAVLLSEMDF